MIKERKLTLFFVAGLIIAALSIVVVVGIRILLVSRTAAPVPVRFDKSEVLGVSERNLRGNFFQSVSDPEYKWLSVSKGAYNKQYYSRDTFVTFIGAVQSESLREPIAHAIDWFAKHQRDDGYIPIWFGESEGKSKIDLGVYYLAPFNRTAETGGIEQYDHVEQFIDAIFLYFEKTKDVFWLGKHVGYAEKSWAYLRGKTNDFLLASPYSDFAGVDWADQIRRNGKATFVNAYWYKVTNDLAEMETALGKKEEGSRYLQYAKGIKGAFNRVLWVESVPTNCDEGKVGHYIGWVDELGKHDYFEVDGNALAVAVGLADGGRASEIMDYINKNFDYFVDKNGATRVLCGVYAKNDTQMVRGTSQNGGYWHIVSYYLAAAEKRAGRIDKLITMWNRVAQADLEYKDQGLTEWDYANGEPGGAMNYSWSLAYPFYLNSLINEANK